MAEAIFIIGSQSGSVSLVTRMSPFPNFFIPFTSPMTLALPDEPMSGTLISWLCSVPAAAAAGACAEECRPLEASRGQLTKDGFSFVGGSGAGFSSGRYAVAVPGSAGNTLIITAWNHDHSTSRVVTLNGVAKNVNLLLNMTLQNTAPRIVSQPPASVQEDTQLAHQVDAVDDEGDPLSYVLQSGPPGMIFSAQGLLSWLPDNDAVGVHQVVVAVSDDSLQAEQAFELEVLNVNDAPEIFSVPSPDAVEDQPYLYQVGALDVDGPPLVYSIPVAPVGMSINQSGLLRWEPGNGDVGAHNVTLQVSDGELSVGQEYTLSVANVNDVPYFTSSPPAIAREDSLLEYFITIEDVDTEALVLALTEGPPGMALNGTRLFWSPVDGDVGLHNVTLEVSDGNLSAEQRFVLLVQDVNDAPVFVSVPVLQIYEGGRYSYIAQASDDEGDALSYQLVQGPEGMTLDASGGELRWHPVHRDLGSHPVQVLASDGNLTASQAFVLDVLRRSTGGGSSALRPNFSMRQLEAEEGDVRVVMQLLSERGPSGIIIRPLTGRPRGASSWPPGPVYKYFAIDLQLPQEMNAWETGADISFEVDDTWLWQLNASPGLVALYRLQGEWERLPTEYLGRQGERHLYHAASPGFSDFAIALELPIAPEDRLGDVVVIAPPVNSISIGGLIYARNGKQVRRGTPFSAENLDAGWQVDGRTGIASDSGRFSVLLQAAGGDHLRLLVDGKEYLSFVAGGDEDALEVPTDLKQGLVLTGLVTGVMGGVAPLLPGMVVLAVLLAAAALLAIRIRIRR